jgi:O-antigen/teichoic acid export membrane protein
VKLARHTLFNFIGLGAPLLAALLTIPMLISLLGVPRFGLLTLIWAVVSYFGLFDLGLGRALTQRLAAVLARESLIEVGPVIGTALALMAAFGLLAGLLMAALADWGVRQISDAPDHAEALNAVLAMSTAVPAVVLTTGLRGVLEARHAFGWVNAIRLPMGLYTFLAPLAVAFWLGPRLDAIAAALVTGRVLALLIHAWSVRRVLPEGRSAMTWQSKQVQPLLATGGWLTVGNLIGPVMGYADRFIIASLASASAVAYYTTPQELVTKLWIVPGAMTAVLFPTFAAAAAEGSTDGWRLAMHGVRWLFVTLLPVTLALSLFADELLTVWVGTSFASNSAPVLRMLSCGILVNCMAHVPLTLLQGSGQARASALLQLVQVVPFVALLWWATASYGVLGTATIWVARMVLDTTAMFLLAARRHRPQSSRARDRKPLLAALAAGVGFAFSMMSSAPAPRIAVWLLVSAAAALLLRPWTRRRELPLRGDTTGA